MSNSVKDIESYLVSKKENILSNIDVYSTFDYAKLFEKKEKGIAQTVYYESPWGKVEYTFIKREIPMKVDGRQYYDITTAYGYGGPHIEDSTNTEVLMAEFNLAFSNYCQNNDIVSEFVRFHLFENQEVKHFFAGEVSFIGQHIARDLSKPLTENFHKTINNKVRKAIKKGLTLTVDTTGKTVESFQNIYNLTMERNHATNFYSFDDEFFQNFHKSLAGKFVYFNAMLDGKVISSFLAVVGERYAYGFIGGTLKEYFPYEAPTFLWYHSIAWMKERGLDYYVLGGGYRENDGIYYFKKKFDSEGEFPFYVGKKIHNEEIYQQLVDIRKSQKNFNDEAAFFPQYRS